MAAGWYWLRTRLEELLTGIATMAAQLGTGADCAAATLRQGVQLPGRGDGSIDVDKADLFEHDVKIVGIQQKRRMNHEPERQASGSKGIKRHVTSVG